MTRGAPLLSVAAHVILVGALFEITGVWAAIDRPEPSVAVVEAPVTVQPEPPEPAMPVLPAAAEPEDRPCLPEAVPDDPPPFPEDEPPEPGELTALPPVSCALTLDPIHPRAEPEGAAPPAAPPPSRVIAVPAAAPKGPPPAAAVAVHRPKPRYPRSAVRRNLEGRVVLLVEVKVDGLVGEVRVKTSSGHDVLDGAAVKAVRTWRFRPAKKAGQPHRSLVVVPITFRLTD